MIVRAGNRRERAPANRLPTELGGLVASQPHGIRLTCAPSESRMTDLTGTAGSGSGPRRGVYQATRPRNALSVDPGADGSAGGRLRAERP